MNKEKVFLLWSGGWDGTFRFLQLVQYNITIQPIYIIDDSRGGTKYEQKAMEQIIEIVRRRFNASVLDIQYYEKQWILKECKDEEITLAFNRLRKRYAVGSQYEWFALLCRKTCLQMESAVVHQYHGKVEVTIENEGSLELIKNDFLPERYHVLPYADSKDPYLVFGNLILPVIKLTKKDEEKIARKNDWLEIMDLSWFCHSPIDGKPCGLCGPCDDAMNTGMEWRMPEESKKRYKYRHLYILLRKINNKIRRR